MFQSSERCLNSPAHVIKGLNLVRRKSGAVKISQDNLIGVLGKLKSDNAEAKRIKRNIIRFFRFVLKRVKRCSRKYNAKTFLPFVRVSVSLVLFRVRFTSTNKSNSSASGNSKPLTIPLESTSLALKRKYCDFS